MWGLLAIRCAISLVYPPRQTQRGLSEVPHNSQSHKAVVRYSPRLPKYPLSSCAPVIIRDSKVPVDTDVIGGDP